MLNLSYASWDTVIETLNGWERDIWKTAYLTRNEVLKEKVFGKNLAKMVKQMKYCKGTFYYIVEFNSVMANMIIWNSVLDYDMFESIF